MIVDDQRTNESRRKLAAWPALCGSFLILNTLLFVPSFVVFFQESTFFPSTTLPPGNRIGGWRLLLLRDNLDVFRLSADLLALFALGVWFPWWHRSPLGRRLQVLTYLGLLAFQTYTAFYRHTFGSSPNLYGDLLTLRQLAPVAWKELMTARLALGILAGLVAAGILVRGIQWIWSVHFQALDRRPSSARARGALLLLLAPVAMILIRYYNDEHLRRYFGDSYGSVLGVQATSVSFLRSVRSSVNSYRHLRSIDPVVIRDHYELPDGMLRQRPNIYFIAIESYGSVAHRHPMTKHHLQTTLQDCERRLRVAGWHVASALSESTVSGGRSWLACTSMTHGIRVDGQGVYEYLNRHFDNYPSMMSNLKRQGYRIYRLSSIPERNQHSVPWDQYTRFYQVDEWIRYRDMEFDGPGYGWTLAPPDQFALGFAHRKIQERDHQPFFLFFITQNSHTPYSAPPLVENWPTLNDPNRKAGSIDDSSGTWVRYQRAIDYQLRFLTRFIEENGSDRDLFILVGDHQPPWLSDSAQDGFRTPLHFITRDGEFSRSLGDWGFRTGLGVDLAAQPLHHEGFYSLFLRQLVKHYGDESTPLPEYLPNGVVFGEGD